MYRFTYTSSTIGFIVKFELPEVNLGDLKFTNLPQYWTATEVTTPTITGTGLKTGTAKAFIDIVQNQISNGSGGSFYPAPFGTGSIEFTATIPTTKTTNANFGLAGTLGTSIIDPPVPDTSVPATTVPEPASLAVLGLALAGLARARRRD